MLNPGSPPIGLSSLWGHSFILSMGHTDTNRKSPNNLPRKTPSQIESVGRFLHLSRQLFGYGSTEINLLK